MGPIIILHKKLSKQPQHNFTVYARTGSCSNFLMLFKLYCLFK